MQVIGFSAVRQEAHELDEDALEVICHVASAEAIWRLSPTWGWPRAQGYKRSTKRLWVPPAALCARLLLRDTDTSLDKHHLYIPSTLNQIIESVAKITATRHAKCLTAICKK